MYDVTALEKRMTAFVIPNAILVTTTQQKYTFTSFLSRDNTYDVIYNVWRLARPGGSSALPSPRGSLDMPDGTSDVGASSLGAGSVGAVKAKVTMCECGKKGEHFSEVAMESVLPGTPEKVYNLMFTSGFIKDFMTQDQNLTGRPIVNHGDLSVRVDVWGSQTCKYPTGCRWWRARRCSIGRCRTQNRLTRASGPSRPSASCATKCCTSTLTTT